MTTPPVDRHALDSGAMSLKHIAVELRHILDTATRTPAHGEVKTESSWGVLWEELGEVDKHWILSLLQMMDLLSNNRAGLGKRNPIRYNGSS